MSDQRLKSTFKKEQTNEVFSVYDHGHDHVDLLGIVIGCLIAVSREAHNFILTSSTGSLLLDDGYLKSMF